LGGRLFPERQILLRSAGRERQLTFPGWLQVALLTTSLTALGAVGGVTGAYLHAHHVIKQKQAEAALAAMSNADIAALVAELRQSLAEDEAQSASIQAQYDDARRQLTVANAQNGALRSAVSQAESRSRSAEGAREDLARHLHSADEARAALQARVQQLDGQLQAALARAKELKLALDSREKQLAATRDQGTAPPPKGRPLAKAAPFEAMAGSTAPAKPAEAAGRSELERLIASTGIDIDKLLERLGALPQGQGGPYLALDARPTLSEQRRAEEVERLAQALPLGAPLAHYSLESTFGSRSDPFHGRQAFHSGVDLSAPYKTPVYATGPGIVIFTGVRDNYGRVVEIDHGHGIVTRYAHLHRILVAKGQKVGPETEIAQLGSTGRSTGPHVHYEVVVDGVPQDPEKFMQAGKGVTQISKK
jgi:murein DD-endopeptidase MepM/ murein hydrolase activator NlpD